MLATAGLLFMLLQLAPNNQTMITVGMGLMGLSMMPLLPIGLETAVECTYPVPEEMSATLLMLVGNVVGLGFTYVMEWMILNGAGYKKEVVFTPVGVLLLSVVGCASGVVFSFQGRYKRLEAEGERERERARVLIT